MSDGSASPEPSLEQDSATMTENKTDRASSEDKSPDQSSNENNTNANGKAKAKSNAKDPSRPRRKKARRACFACQRAHLTCGDERPCTRCIKRGLQDQCQDGVRKKAKYLHDAPAEALMPGFAGNYHHPFNGSHSMSIPTPSTMGPTGLPVSQPGAYYSQSSPPTNFQFSPIAQHGPLGPHSMDGTLVGDFTGQANVDTPAQFRSNSSQVSPVQDIATTLDQSSALGNPGNLAFDGSFYDPSDPSLFNFNISDLNFGNHYGALEFGMLGHLSSGANNTPDVDLMNSLHHSNHGRVSYDGITGFSSNLYNQNFHPWQTAPNSSSRQGSSTNPWDINATGMDGFAVRENSVTGASPHSQSQDFSAGSQLGTLSPEVQFAQPGSSSSHHTDFLRHSLSQTQSQSHPQSLKRKASAFPDSSSYFAFKKRPRDTSTIYSSVKEEYPYTARFHVLLDMLKKRLPAHKLQRVAKALSLFRPSFISCNQSLTTPDLIFMEQGAQRTLLEHQFFASLYGTPTLVLRRTGEVAHATKEFEILSGWKLDVLLGYAPNLNVNYGNSGSGSQTGASSKGDVTPHVPDIIDTGSSGPQPVFVCEVLDVDDTVQFFEDFAENAFAGSKTNVQRMVTIIKYKTKEDVGWGAEDRLEGRSKRLKTQPQIKTEHIMRADAGLYALGHSDGRVDCAYCWTIKRDMFEVPMFILMNFLPEI